MHVGMLTREYPPDVYGGAGTHVRFLVPHLRELVDVAVHRVGSAIDHPAPKPRIHTHTHTNAASPEMNPALHTLAANVAGTAATAGADLVHSHTWHANFAGHLAKLLHDVPHVATAHSLEPLRPWKADQLGAGYRLSSWAERTSFQTADAIIAVSRSMRADLLHCYPELAADRIHVVHNGVDTRTYRPTADPGLLHHWGIDETRPIVLFVGRLTPQKGLDHLLAAAEQLDSRAQLVLCAITQDVPEAAGATTAAIRRLVTERPGTVWLPERLTSNRIAALLSHASVLVCPSVYEPFGLVNLEAMACGTAVVAADTGGIPEVVADGSTGLIVPGAAGDEHAFQRDLATAINELVTHPERAERLGSAGRERAERDFTWSEAARRTVAVYRRVTGG